MGEEVFQLLRNKAYSGKRGLGISFSEKFTEKRGKKFKERMKFAKNKQK